jgi:hypothetical protein
MAGNGVKTWRARELWGAIKVAAAEDGDLIQGFSRVALTIWGRHDAGEKVSHDRSHREAFVASLVGASAVDTVIDKLAQDGTLSTPEAEYMRNLNAEAALRDLGQFQKTANVFKTVAQFIAQHPQAVGTVAGTVAGAGFGAYADDDNRLRGAIRFGVPGAIMGGMLGHGVAQMHAEEARLALEELYKAQERKAKLEALLK